MGNTNTGTIHNVNSTQDFQTRSRIDDNGLYTTRQRRAVGTTNTSQLAHQVYTYSSNLQPKPGYQSVFNKVSTGSRVGYSTPQSQHLKLRKQSEHTLLHLDSIFGSQISNTLPPRSGPIQRISHMGATYQGDMVQGHPHGQGVAHFIDGGYYAGNFVDGDAQGNGVYIFPNGSLYVGQFNNSTFNGMGCLIYTDKRMRYDGIFVNGVPNGQGRETYNDHSYYDGQFVNGLKQGYGRYVWSNNQSYQGNFSNGLMHGQGVLKNGSDITYKGSFVQGMKNGQGVFRTPEGTYWGRFQRDQLNGPGSFLWNDGKAYQGEFKNTMMHGRGRMYYKSNQVAEGEWSNNHNTTLTTVKNDPSEVAQIFNKLRQRHGLSQIPKKDSLGQLNSGVQSRQSMSNDSYNNRSSNFVLA